MKLSWARLLLIAIALVSLAYAVDRVSIVYRIPNGRRQFGSVEVKRLLAVPQKDRKTEYIAEPAEEQHCVQSLFPQLGFLPCWYLSRHANQEIDY
jgi:hypothetical protein